MPPSRQNNPRRGGRIYPHDRNVDDSVPLLGVNLTVDVEYQRQYHEAQAVAMEDKSRKDYRCRLLRIIKYWEKECPDYYRIGVRQVTKDELNDGSKFYYGRYHYDLIYTGLNVTYVLHFLLNNKSKENGKLKSITDLRKYRDAILWGAEIAGHRLPTNFYEEMDKFKVSYKRQFINAKKTGDVDEAGADPISVTLYQAILRWSIENNNIFVWFWTLLQWGCMARGASIDPLAFHNFRLGQDSIIVKYDNQKADKAGERLSEKNLYANPFEWKQCLWTGMGIYCALHCDTLADHERLFLKQAVKEGAATGRYSEQLLSIVDRHKDEVMVHMLPEKFNPYGFRKGSATYAVSGTTVTPSLPSVARRGEWSQGQVLDVYWHFASIGDHFLGRLLACLHPNELGFATLPPHWTTTNPMENPHICKAMKMMYRPILNKYKGQPNDPTPLLLRCLACVVHHVNTLLDVMVKIPGHDFCKLPLFHHRELINELQNLVTTEPTPGVIYAATGIPPHIELATQVQSVLDNTSQLMTQCGHQTSQIISAVKDAIEEKAWDSGHVTGTKLLEVLTKFQSESLQSVDQRLGDIRTEFSRALALGRGGNVSNGLEEYALPTRKQGAPGTASTLFTYKGKMYAVPENFNFPKVKLREATRFWLCGQSVSKDGCQRIKPFKKLTTKDLPDNLKNAFKLTWLSFFKFLNDPAIFHTEGSNDSPTEDEINGCFDRCVNYLKSSVSYCFAKNKDPINDWLLSTWSVRVTRSSIERYGHDSDKAKLGPPGNQNKSRLVGGKRKRIESCKPKYLHRQRERIRRVGGEQRREIRLNSAWQQHVAHQELQEDVDEEDGLAQFAARRGEGTMIHNRSDALRKHSENHACPIPGCKWPQNVPDHRCYRRTCGNLVHNLCAQTNDLCDDDNELNMYCSVNCKRVGRSG